MVTLDPMKLLLLSSLVLLFLFPDVVSSRVTFKAKASEALGSAQLDSIVVFLVLLVNHQFRLTFELSLFAQMHLYNIYIALQVPLEVHRLETSSLRTAFLEPIYLPLVQLLKHHHLIFSPQEAAQRFLLL